MADEARVTQVFGEVVQALEPPMERATQIFGESIVQLEPPMMRQSQIFVEVIQSLADLPAFKPKTMSF